MAAERSADVARLGGLGLGWRPALATVAADRPLGFLEVVAESISLDVPVPSALRSAIDDGTPVIAHGVSLGLGSAEPVDRLRLQRLGDVATQLGSPIVSEHIAFVGAAGLSAGHLLPLPRTFEALAVLSAHVREAQAQLPVPLALEHVAALFEWPDAEMDPADFLCRLLDETGCLLLLDVANLYGDAVNFGHDPLALLDRIPFERVAYAHVAGGIARDGVWHDSHAGPVPEQVFDLVADVQARRPGLGMLLERDDRWPTSGQLNAELDRLQALIAEPARV